MARELTIDNPVLVIDGATIPCESVKIIEDTVRIFDSGNGSVVGEVRVGTKLVVVLKPEDLKYRIVDGKYEFAYISVKTENGKDGCWFFSKFDSQEAAVETTVGLGQAE